MRHWRVGIEATGHTHWFEAMLAELGHELWMGDAAKIRAAVVRKQKTDARDAAHLLELMCSERFPKIWRPSGQSGICDSWCGIGRSWYGCEER